MKKLLCCTDQTVRSLSTAIPAWKKSSPQLATPGTTKANSYSYAPKLTKDLEKEKAQQR